MKPDFTKKLLAWNSSQNQRSMPWKGEKDPYRIWLSEIILQQTRVEQGWDYYLSFISTFPAVKDLATAPEAKVFKLWEGLGYYSRCRNLIATAKLINEKHKGIFPSTYEAIINLKGIGPYTAAAIASFAFNLPYAVVDGNVLRVIARIYGIDKPADSPQGRELLNKLAGTLLDKRSPGAYNQAIMDFGAVICKPKAPLCQSCFMKKSCVAFNKGLVDRLPVKEKKINKKTRWFYYYIIRYNTGIYIKERQDRDIWRHLHEFFLLEKAERMKEDEITMNEMIKPFFEKYGGRITTVSKLYSQQLTHQTIRGQFIELSCQKPPVMNEQFKKINARELAKHAFPKFITTYLQEKNVNLSQL
jgi:A/G-specific adenine glycosylase